MKSGYKTTEFYVTIATGLVTAAVALGFIDISSVNEIADKLTAVQEFDFQGDAQVNQLAEATKGMGDTVSRLVSLVVGGNVVNKYIKSRGDSKNPNANKTE